MGASIRMIIACRAVDSGTLNTWWRNNIDKEGGDAFNVPLQLTTDPPGTVRAYWAGVSLYPEQAKTIAAKMAQMAAIAFPADWDSLTLAEQRQWYQDNKAVLLSAARVRIRFCNSGETWDDPDELLAEAGYQRAVL